MRKQEQQTQIQVFSNKEFGQLEVVMVDDKPHFPATECAKVLGYGNPQQAIRLHCKGVLKLSTPSNGGNQAKNFISEGDLYRLIARSTLPSAVQFESFIFDEVMPTIRKTGCYVTDELRERLAASEEVANKFWHELKTERNQKNALERKHTALRKDLIGVMSENSALKAENELLEDCIEDIFPKADYCDTVLECENAMPVTVIAKDYGITAVKFNQILRDIGVQYKVGGANGTWVLQQKYVGEGYTKTVTFEKGGRAFVWTCWTQRGRLFLYDILQFYGIMPLVERS